MAQEEKSWSFWDCCCGGQWENLSATESLDIGMTMDEEERQSSSAATNTTTGMMQNDGTDLDPISTEGSAQGELWHRSMFSQAPISSMDRAVIVNTQLES